MRKFLVLIGFLFVSNSSFSAETKMDQELLDLGLIDKNYKYKNLKDVGIHFKNASNIASLSLPTMINSEEEVVAITANPYFSIYSLKLHRSLTSEEKKILSQRINKKERVDNLCKTMFSSKFQKANNYVVKYIYTDLNDKFITETRLDSTTCK